MANYNSAKFITETLNSVIAQTYRNWEVVIVDDYSTDDSVEIIKKFQLIDSRVKLIKLKVNSGPAIARNTAIDVADGQFIAFLDSDDLWENVFLSRSIDFMVRNNYEFVCSSYSRKNETLDVDFGCLIVPFKVCYIDLLKSNTVSCLTAIYDSSKLGKHSMPLLEKRQDLGLWLLLLEKVKYCYGIPEPLATYRIRRSSLSSNKLNSAKHTWILYSGLDKINFFQKVYFFCLYAINGFVKYKNVKR